MFKNIFNSILSSSPYSNNTTSNVQHIYHHHFFHDKEDAHIEPPIIDSEAIRNDGISDKMDDIFNAFKEAFSVQNITRSFGNIQVQPGSIVDKIMHSTTDK